MRRDHWLAAFVAVAVLLLSACGGSAAPKSSPVTDPPISDCKLDVRTINTALQAFYADSTSTPPAFPAGPSVTLMLSQLVAARMLTSEAGMASTRFGIATYSPATGTYDAPCP